MRPIIAIALLSIATWYCARVALAERRREIRDEKEAEKRWENEGGAPIAHATGQRG
jgi:hypothetical protein